MKSNFNHGTRSLIALLFVVPVGLASAAASDTLATQAYWAAHNEIDYLDNLPRRYSCNDLYYKFRDVLLNLGARPGMQIYAYGCTGRGEATAKQTPHVELTYEVPKAAPPGTLSNSTFKAVLKTVKVGPGTPKSITSADCVLLDDMRQTLIKALARGVTSIGNICGGSARRSPFTLQVAALLPVSPSLPGATATQQSSG